MMMAMTESISGASSPHPSAEGGEKRTKERLIHKQASDIRWHETCVRSGDCENSKLRSENHIERVQENLQYSQERVRRRRSRRRTKENLTMQILHVQ
jgi:hypothetical protein